jgi:perosamine synthetase
LNAGSLADDVFSALREVLGGISGVRAVHEPEFSGNEWKYVRECLDTGWVSSVGAYVDLFEHNLAEYTGAAHAVVTANGTAALHICLMLAGVQSGDEVLVPTLTFVATANAVSYCGAIPHFVDSSVLTLGLDAEALRRHLENVADMRAGVCVNRTSGRRIRAVVPMHTFGQPVDMDRLLVVAKTFNLAVVEDAAESLGSFYRGRHTGNFGAVSALSFNGNKIVTTGGGGAILTNDPQLAARAKHLTTTARVTHGWEFKHDEVGYNYRMPNINAALGCAQLESLPAFVARKRALASRYTEAFRGLPGATIYRECEFSCSNYWLNTLILDEPDLGLRDGVLTILNQRGFAARPAWTLMHRLPMYSRCPCASLAVAERLEAQIINLPSSAKLADS